MNQIINQKTSALISLFIAETSVNCHFIVIRSFFVIGSVEIARQKSRSYNLEIIRSYFRAYFRHYQVDTKGSHGHHSLIIIVIQPVKSLKQVSGFKFET